MADSALRDAAREYARVSRAEQGLPPAVEDPATVGRIVALLRQALPRG